MGSSIKDRFLSSAYFAIIKNEEKHSVRIPEVGSYKYANCNFHKIVHDIIKTDRFEPAVVIKRCNEIMQEYGIPKRFALKDFPDVVKKMQQDKLAVQKSKTKAKENKAKAVNSKEKYTGRD